MHDGICLRLAVCCLQKLAEHLFFFGGEEICVRVSVVESRHRITSRTVSRLNESPTYDACYEHFLRKIYYVK